MDKEIKLDNHTELNNIMDDYHANEQYFMDIDEIKCINDKIETALSKYTNAVNKVMSMVNVTKILNLEIPCDGSYGRSHCVVLSNQGLRSRYISDSYITQTDTLEYNVFGKVFGEAIKIIFAHPNISMVQKNKIMPLKNIDVSFLSKISANRNIKIEGVRRIKTNLSVEVGEIIIPNFSVNTHYGTMSLFSLLSVRTQISKQMNEYLLERRAITKLIEEKHKEIEALFPIIFMFGDE